MVTHKIMVGAMYGGWTLPELCPGCSGTRAPKTKPDVQTNSKTCPREYSVLLIRGRECPAGVQGSIFLQRFKRDGPKGRRTAARQPMGPA